MYWCSLSLVISKRSFASESAFKTLNKLRIGNFYPSLKKNSFIFIYTLIFISVNHIWKIEPTLTWSPVPAKWIQTGFKCVFHCLGSNIWKYAFSDSFGINPGRWSTSGDINSASKI